MKVKLALSGRLFEADYRTNTIGFREFAGLARKIGYDGVELRRTQVSLETPASYIVEYHTILQDNGLDVVCMTPRGLDVLNDHDLLKKYLDLASKLGCRHLKMGGDPEKTRAAAEIAAGYSIRIGRNNHIHTEADPGPTETIDRTIDYLKQVDHPNFGILYDTAHLFISGSDYGPQAVASLGDKVFYVLVQSVAEVPEPGQGKLTYHNRHFRTALPGEANSVDFQAVFNGLSAIDYEGYIGVIAEKPGDRDPRDVAEIYYDLIHAML